MLRSWRRTALLIVGLSPVLALTSCTPSGYLGARSTVAIAARAVGIPLTAKQVACQPVDGVTFHRCTAPIGPGGASVALVVQVGSITTPFETIENVVVDIPASLARGSYRKTQPRWRYLTETGWEKRRDGTWAIRADAPPRTFLLDQDNQVVREL